MFYSHESKFVTPDSKELNSFLVTVLTERRHGLAVVWLVATLGSKPRGKKVNKKALLGVNIPKACDTVTEPVVPMALRLQSNLLVGISRVFSSQCNFVLSDAESIQQNIRMLFGVLRSSQLDPNAGKARPEQQIIPEDPFFAPDVIPQLSLDLDLSTLELETQSPSLLSRESTARISSRTSNNDSMIGGFGLKVSSTSGGDILGSGAVRPVGFSEDSLFEFGNEQALIIDPGFHIDEEGNLRDDEDVPLPQYPPAIGLSDTDIAERLRQDSHYTELGRRAQLQMQMGREIMPFFDEEPISQLEVLPAGRKPSGEESEEFIPEETTEMEDQIEASSKRPRRPRGLPPDTTLEVRRTEVLRWQTDYTDIMRIARKKRDRKVLPSVAKRVAYQYVWGNGLAGLGHGTRLVLPDGPLNEYHGDALRRMICGSIDEPASRKRSIESGSSDNERKVRRRIEEIEQARGIRDKPVLFGDDDDREIERGRQAQPKLDDISSQMPWNIASSTFGGSRTGSTRLPRSRAGSVTRPGSVGLPPLPFSAGEFPSSLPSTDPFGHHRRSRSRRPPSESPLQGRGASGVKLSSEGDDTGIMPGLVMQDDSAALEDFELFGPAAAVSTQVAAGSQWVRDALRTEDANFLDFVEAELDRRDARAVAFADMLPPATNSRIVATQGFLHVLNLASSNLLLVRQDDWFDAPIHLELPDVLFG